MTIKEASKKYGVSTQAIYQRLKKHDIELSTVRDSVSGQLLQSGEELLEQLFTKQREEVDNESTTRLEEIQSVKEQLLQVVNERNALRADVSRLEAELRGERELRSAIERERDTLRTALDQSQQLQAMTLSRIPEPRKSLWQRLTERKRLKDGEARI